MLEPLNFTIHFIKFLLGDNQYVFNDVDNWYNIITNPMSFHIVITHCKTNDVVLLLMSGNDVNIHLRMNSKHIYYPTGIFH